MDIEKTVWIPATLVEKAEKARGYKPGTMDWNAYLLGLLVTELLHPTLKSKGGAEK